MRDPNVTAPESVDQYIQNGIQKGKTYRKRRRQSITSVVTTLTIALLFVTCVKVSPAFANALRDIPGFSMIIELIEGDKGLEDALANDFIHKVDVSDTHEEITFSIDHIIVDQARAILFYSITTEGDHNFLFLNELEMLGDGEPLSASTGYGSPSDSVNLQKEERMNGKIVATFTDGTDVPDVLTVSTGIKASTIAKKILGDEAVLNSTWEVQIPIKESWYENTREVLPIDQNVKIEGQIIHFEKAIIDPTLAAIYVRFDPENEMQLFRFDDLKIVDDKGEVWSPPDGLVSTGADDRFILYYESPHFRIPRELYLKGSSIRAIDKDEQNIVVDLTSEKLIKAPSDDRIELFNVKKTEERVNLEFAVKMTPRDHDHIYEIFNTRPLNVETPDEVRTLKNWWDPEANTVFHSFSVINPKKEKKLIIELIDYPNRLVEPFQIQIK